MSHHIGSPAVAKSARNRRLEGRASKRSFLDALLLPLSLPHSFLCSSDLPKIVWSIETLCRRTSSDPRRPGGCGVRSPPTRRASPGSPTGSWTLPTSPTVPRFLPPKARSRHVGFPAGACRGYRHRLVLPSPMGSIPDARTRYAQFVKLYDDIHFSVQWI